MSEQKKISEMTKDALLKFVIEQQQQKESLIIALNTARASRKVVKEISDFFINKKREQQVFSNLSETKKHLESKHEDILKALIHDEKVTNDEFNAILVKTLRTALLL